jgi:hypothetical protein
MIRVHQKFGCCIFLSTVHLCSVAVSVLFFLCNTKQLDCLGKHYFILWRCQLILEPLNKMLMNVLMFGTSMGTTAWLLEAVTLNMY